MKPYVLGLNHISARIDGEQIVVRCAKCGAEKRTARPVLLNELTTGLLHAAELHAGCEERKP